MSSTRNDGMPTPDPDTYWLLIALAWLAVPFVEIFGTIVLIGIRRSPETRATYSPSWAWCCVIAGTAALVFYSALHAAYRHGGRAAAKAQRLQRRTRREQEAELDWDLRREQLFGIRQMPVTLVMSPLLWALPLSFSCSMVLPRDPATGDVGVDPENMAISMILPVVTLILWAATGFLLTALSVAPWLAFAVCTETGYPKTADVIGFVGIGMLVVAIPAVIAIRRRMVDRQAAADDSARVMPSLTGPARTGTRARLSRTNRGLLLAYRSLQTLMGLAFVVMVVFASITLYQLPHSSGSHLALTGSAAIVAAGVFYATLFAVRRSGTREIVAMLLPQPFDEWTLQTPLEAVREERRADLVAPRRVPLAIAITPSLWMLPVWIGGLAYAPRDPDTGERGPNLANLAVGAILLFVAPYIWRHASRTLTALCLLVWAAWAAGTLAGHPLAGAVIAGVGILLLFAAVRGATSRR